MRVESLESRALLAATPLGVTPIDTGEILLGKVLVTPVFLESAEGIAVETEDWDAAGGEIDEVLDTIIEGTNWWSTALDQLNTVHDVEFAFDETFARTPYEIDYEPIMGSSELYVSWVGDFLKGNGYGVGTNLRISANMERAIREFNDDQRIKHDADWSFTIFVVDSSDDFTGFFKSGSLRGAFAFPGGQFIVTPSTRPVTTIAHEVGHMFWARDEYATSQPWDVGRGYYDVWNLNSVNNTTPGFVQDISIMRGGTALFQAYQSFYSPESTLAHVGWRDSDGDGIFDLADVPLDLQATGYFDDASSTYRFYGTASAVPLMNQNSSGPQSDITFNRISRLEYRLDDGPWQTAATPDAQVVEFDEVVDIQQPFNEIHWRVIDDQVGVTSPMISGTPTTPAFTTAGITGVAFIDNNADAEFDVEELALVGTTVVVTHTDGSPLFSGGLDASDFSDGALAGSGGATLGAIGDDFSSTTGVATLAGHQDKTLHWYDSISRTWNGLWSGDVKLEASLDEPVGMVTVDAIAIDEPSFLRLEAYDANGQFLHRVTSDAIELGQTGSLTITDPHGRIAKIRAYGHAKTSVGLRSLQFGYQDQMTTDDGGGFQIKHLPDGSYRVELTSENVIHQFAASTVSVDVVQGVGTLVVAAAQRVDSIRHNELNPFDTNRDGSVSSRDALVVINDLDRNQPRRLSPAETDGFDVDVTNDGFVSAVDALVIINQLARQTGGASGEAVGEVIVGAESFGAQSVVASSSGASTDTGEDESFIGPVLPTQNGGGSTQVAVFSTAPSAVSSGVIEVTSSQSESTEQVDLSEPFLQPLI